MILQPNLTSLLLDVSAIRSLSHPQDLPEPNWTSFESVFLSLYCFFTPQNWSLLLYSMSLFDWSLISFMDLPTSLRSSIDEASSDSALFYCMMLVMRSMTLFSFNVTPMVL